jgi:putative FmdB family regulatory protein
MPLYEYQCPECGNFEIVQKFSDAPIEVCPHCQKRGAENKVTKLLSSPSFHLKGSGWYKSDYASSSSSSTSGKTSTSTSSASSSKESLKTVDSKPCGGGCSCH